MKRMTALIALLCVALCCFAACTKQATAATPVSKASDASQYPKQMGQAKSTDTYTENKVTLWNEETQRKFKCLEVIPKGIADDEKVPMIVYIHGLNGNEESLVDEPEALAAHKIAGITFEAGTCIIDGKSISPAHYTYRISDFEAVLAYVKTLPYVDGDRIYIYGQSYGGLVAMAAAPRHDDDTAGMILESTGLDAEGGMIKANEQETLRQYDLPEDWKAYILRYNRDVIVCCSEGDTGAYANGQYTADLYAERADASATFYSCPEGKHAFAAFSAEGKAITLDAMRDLVLQGNTK